MEVFSIICLVVLFIGLQHLLNYLWRKAVKNSSLHTIVFLLTLICGVISAVIIYHIILWGKNLL